MFDWIKKLFGEGKVRVEFTLTDGRTGVAKAKYIGDPSTFDVEEFKARIYVEYGASVKSIDGITFSEQ